MLVRNKIVMLGKVVLVGGGLVGAIMVGFRSPDQNWNIMEQALQASGGTFQKQPLNLPSYDPKNCSRMVNGHCDDVDGGGWTYKTNENKCTYVETSPEINNAPKDNRAVVALPNIFPDVQSVLDFGGGVGVYLTGFRNKGIFKLVTVEPHSLQGCLFQGIEQDTTDWINSPQWKLPKKAYDLVMTIEVLEHIPVAFHQHVIQSLAQATSKWLLFSAAHPGQPGEGHIGPSMKGRDQWIQEIQNWTSLVVDQPKTDMLYNASGAGSLLKTNAVIFQKVR